MSSYSILNYVDLVKELHREYDTGRKLLILTDKNVERHYSRLIKEIITDKSSISVVSIVPGEKSKTWDTTYSLTAKMLQLGFSRRDLLVNLGGGVVSDLGGFVAANYMRGIDYINIPTTIIGQIDASLGGKTAINILNTKNVFGSFHNPQKIFVVPEFIESLPREEIISGYGEIVKYAVLIGQPLLPDEKYLTVVQNCLNYKEQLVELDPFDFNQRMVLNLGHTLGHALEVLLDWSHGRAVGYGIIFAAALTCEMDGSSIPFIRDLVKQLRKVDLLQSADLSQIDIDALETLIFRDKKRDAINIRWILPRNWGNIKISAVDEITIRTVLEKFLRGEYFA